MKYFIVFLMLIILSMYAAIDAQIDQHAEMKNVITDLKTSLSMANNVVTILEDFRRPPENYSYINPVHNEDYKQLTSPFGLREIPHQIYTGGAIERKHDGLDLSGTWRARILSVADGEVIDNYYPPGNRWEGHPVLGGMIRIQHTDGRISVYGHLSANYVNETDKRFVTAGQVIGRMGNSGISTGQHLHFELWENGEALQPLKYINIGDKK
jgi:murein DD-endopeptidase MepM/ murein hydrolase activator NlpD